MKKWYGVEIRDIAWYEVEAESPEEAQEIAEEWFSQRSAEIHVEELDKNSED